MDEFTKALHSSIYEYFETNKFSSAKKGFVKDTKFDAASLSDSSVVKVSLKQLFQDHLASQKKDVIDEESSDSSSSDSSDSDSDSDDEKKPVAKKVVAAAESSSDSDSSDSDSEDEKKPVVKKVVAAAESSSDSDSSDSDSDSEDEKKPVANGKVRPNISQTGLNKDISY